MPIKKNTFQIYILGIILLSFFSCKLCFNESAEYTKEYKSYLCSNRNFNTQNQGQISQERENLLRFLVMKTTEHRLNLENTKIHLANTMVLANSKNLDSVGRSFDITLAFLEKSISSIKTTIDTTYLTDESFKYYTIDSFTQKKDRIDSLMNILHNLKLNWSKSNVDINENHKLTFESCVTAVEAEVSYLNRLIEMKYNYQDLTAYNQMVIWRGIDFEWTVTNHQNKGFGTFISMGGRYDKFDKRIEKGIEKSIIINNPDSFSIYNIGMSGMGPDKWWHRNHITYINNSNIYFIEKFQRDLVGVRVDTNKASSDYFFCKKSAKILIPSSANIQKFIENHKYKVIINGFALSHIGKCLKTVRKIANFSLDITNYKYNTVEKVIDIEYQIKATLLCGSPECSDILPSFYSLNTHFLLVIGEFEDIQTNHSVYRDTFNWLKNETTDKNYRSQKLTDQNPNNLIAGIQGFEFGTSNKTDSLKGYHMLKWSQYLGIDTLSNSLQFITKVQPWKKQIFFLWKWIFSFSEEGKANVRITPCLLSHKYGTTIHTDIEMRADWNGNAEHKRIRERAHYAPIDIKNLEHLRNSGHY